MGIRPASLDDVPAMLDIYRPIVESTPISFELEPPTVEEFAARVAKYSHGWAWLVYEDAGGLLGYAYGAPHRDRLAYQWTTETSAYVSDRARRRGVARQLYDALFEILAKRGYCGALAGITLPNPASVALHESVGFRLAGVFPAVGYKLGRWHDVAWYSRLLIDPLPAAPAI